MSEQAIYSERIEWCDIYKGLLMVLVVIGHSTGMFNQYIYQFHMAAFFVISGYTSRLDKKSFFHMVVDKSYRIMLPFFFLGISGDVVFYISDRLNILDRVSTTIYSVSLQQAIQELFSKNLMIYCDWLGALWFLPVLFFATILVKFICYLTREHSRWMFLVSLFVFWLSEKNIAAGNTNVILAGLAQFFFIIGILLRRAIDKYGKNQNPIIYTVIWISVLCLLWYVCSNTFIRITVDWPSRNFNGTIKDILLPAFGVIVTYMFSLLFSHFKIPNKIFSYIGKNTMGVMCFHFVAFKAAYALLILLNCMKWEDFSRLTPPVEVGNRYWLFIGVVSLSVSLFVWNILNRIGMLSCLLGRSKVTLGRMGKTFEEVIRFFDNTFKEMCLKIDKKLYWFIAILTIFFCVLLGSRNIIRITFPDSSSNASFGEGWLLQGEGENYRWVDKVSKFSVVLVDQSELHIEGYVPDNITDMNKAVIYINGDVVLDTNLQSGKAFIYDIMISEHIKKYAENEIRLEFDGTRIPKETDADQRKFSALISAIEIR